MYLVLIWKSPVTYNFCLPRPNIKHCLSLYSWKPNLHWLCNQNDGWCNNILLSFQRSHQNNNISHMISSTYSRVSMGIWCQQRGKNEQYCIQLHVVVVVSDCVDQCLSIAFYQSVHNDNNFISWGHARSEHE